MSLLVLLVVLLLAVWGYMTAWFVVAMWGNRVDLVDSAWGLGFVYVAWLTYAIIGHHGGVQQWSLLLVTLWGLRLFGHLTIRNMKKAEDRRYQVYREKWGKDFWQSSYLRIFSVQGLLLWLISWSTIGILSALSVPITWLAVAGLLVWGFGILFEAISDWQLQRFMQTRKTGQIMTGGLWKYSRHPNYFGEITAWWGAGLVAVSFRQWWGLIGSLTITYLIVKVSGIPLLEKHYEGNKEYEAYKKRTPVLIPLPSRKK